MLTADDLFAMYDRYITNAPAMPTFWLVNPRLRNRMARADLAVRKAWPARPAYRRAVNRAYRRAGIRLPNRPTTDETTLMFRVNARSVDITS